MASNDALKASPSEIKSRTVAALLRERAGYEQRLVGAEEIDDEEDRAGAAAMLQRRIDDVNASLKRLGHEASPPAKRAEKRPGVGRGAESR